MQTSILIARLIGPILVVTGFTSLFNPKVLHEIGQEFLASRALIFIAGFLALLGGLAELCPKVGDGDIRRRVWLA